MLAENLLPDGRLRFDHLGVLVPDLAHGRHLLSSVLGVSCWTVEFEDPVNDVFIQFGRCPGGMCYETVAPRSALSPVRNALKRRVNIFNHVAWGAPNTTFTSPNFMLYAPANASGVGYSDTTSNTPGPRRIQLGFRVAF